MQLLLKDLETTPLVRGALATMDSLLEKLDNPEKLDKLKSLQQAANGTEGSVPIKPAETRLVTNWKIVLHCHFFLQVVKQNICNGASD
jgi:hypothetical protein